MLEAEREMKSHLQISYPCPRRFIRLRFLSSTREEESEKECKEHGLHHNQLTSLEQRSISNFSRRE